MTTRDRLLLTIQALGLGALTLGMLGAFFLPLQQALDKLPV